MEGQGGVLRWWGGVVGRYGVFLWCVGCCAACCDVCVVVMPRWGLHVGGCGCRCGSRCSSVGWVGAAGGQGRCGVAKDALQLLGSQFLGPEDFAGVIVLNAKEGFRRERNNGKQGV